MNAIIKEYLWSALITFIWGFGVAVLPMLVGLPPEQSAIFGLIAVGSRAGVAAVVNLIATKGSTISSK